MRRLLPLLLGCTLAAFTVLLNTGTSTRAAEAPYSGTWKVNLHQLQAQITLCLAEIQDQGGKPQAKVLSVGLGQLKGENPKLEDVKTTDDKALHMTFKAGRLSIPFVFYPAKDEAKPKKLLGTASLNGQVMPAELVRTDLKEISEKESVAQDPAWAMALKALRNQDAKQKLAGLKEVLDNKEAGPALIHQIGILLLQQLVSADTIEADVKPQAEKIIKATTGYGPELHLQTLQEVGNALVTSEKLAPLALDYGRQAEKLLGQSPTPEKRLPVLKLLGAALRKTGKAEDAKKFTEEIAKIDAKLDEEYVKTAIPFKPETFAGRKGKSDKVVLVELFTGAQCPPCVSADIAFDALLKTYKADQVVLLQYHLHIPRPDPLTNADSEKRSEYYTIRGTPTLFIDGQEGPAVGGFKPDAKGKYDTLIKSLGTNLETEPQAKLKLKADRKGDDITIQADVSDLKKTGDDVHLRLVLVEDVVRYAGSNGQRLHHHVVRAFPGGLDKFVLKDNKAKHEVKVNLGELKKSLNTYLSGVSKQKKVDFADAPLDLKNLKIVAFIQDDLLKEVLQVAQVSLSADKTE